MSNRCIYCPRTRKSGRREGAMEKGTAALLGTAALAAAALAAFLVSRWRQRNRVRRVAEWVTDHLVSRYGGPLENLNVNCSDDPLWPVLVTCDDPRTRTRHSRRLSCAELASAFSLTSEKSEPLTTPARY